MSFKWLHFLTIQLLRRNGIEAAFTPRVALGDAAQGEKGSFKRSALLQGFESIGGAAGVKTASAAAAERMEQRRN